jgi:hypothetical protein
LGFSLMFAFHQVISTELRSLLGAILPPAGSVVMAAMQRAAPTIPASSHKMP